MSSTKSYPTGVKSADLKDQSMKQVDLEDGKVKILLSRVKGEVYATSALCTHYGVPLAAGVMDDTGRVVCKAHGACFNLCTGDIEDAPGLDALFSYKVIISDKDGEIIVEASEKETKSKVGRSPLKSKAAIAKATGGKKEDEEHVVIVGGGSGGLHCLESLREHGFGGKITLIGKEEFAPFDRTKLSKALITDPSKLIWRTSEELKNDFKVDLHLSTEVTKISTSSQTVTTSTGTDIKYDHLVLAPGAVAKKIPIEGNDLDGVKVMRGIEDAKEIVDGINSDAKIVIIGTSFIGIELAGSIIGKKPASVDIIGVDKIPFAAILGEEVGKAVQKDLEGKGVKFHMDSNIEKIEGSESDPKKAGSIKLKDAPSIPCTMVIMGTGVSPSTQFLSDSGLELQKDKGVNVDEFMHVVDSEGKPIGDGRVYALGDIAHYPQYPKKERRRVEHWNVAGNTGRIVGQNIAVPEKPKAYTKIPIFWSSVGGGLRYVGSGAGQDESYIDGDLSKELKFVGYYAKDDVITAVSSIGRDPYVAQSAELMRLGLMPKLSEIKGGKDVMQIQLKGKIGN